MPTHPAVLPSDSAPVAKPQITTVEFWADDNQVVTINLRAHGMYVTEAQDGSGSTTTNKSLHAALLRALEITGGGR